MTKKFPEAINYAMKSIIIRKTLNNNSLMATGYQNLGYVYYQAGQKEKATENFIKASDYLEKISDKTALAGIYNNIAVLFQEQNNQKMALEYYAKSLDFYKLSDDKLGQSQTNSNMAQLYILKKDFPKAKAYLDQAMFFAQALNSKKEIEGLYFVFSEWHLAQNQYQKSLEYYKLATAIKDSLTDNERNKQFAESQAKFESNEKDKEIQLLNKDKALQHIELERQTAEAEKQQAQRNAFILGFLMLLALVVFVYRGYREKKKDNLIIESQKMLVEEKNKDITDSINYAKRIQEAILPTQELKNKLFPSSFVLFEPRDIVSGDFFWFAEKKGKKIIAAADCTGHGVPGAFMSMIGTAFLNEIVNSKDITTPSKILDNLRERIIVSLKQQGMEGENRDGMDIGLLSFDENNRTVEFAGANNPLWIIRNGVLEEIKGNKQPIGFHEGVSQPFIQHSIPLNKGDTLFLLTDGFADQFGGPNGKKFKYKQLQHFLIAEQHLSMPALEMSLRDKLQEWKGNLEQVDDVLLIGIRV
jgi:serine phosphatase RsbU (regulator of sigma subunit)